MESLPDLIHCVLPPLELAEAATLFAGKHGIPISIDIMDTWPDVYLIVLPSLLRPLGKAALFAEYSRLRRICARADAFTAISPDYLDWAVRHGHRGRRDADAVFALGAPSPPPEERRPSAIDDSVQERLDGRLVATFLGSFISMCDVQVVVRAAERLSARGRDDVIFVIAGDGPNAARIRRRAMNRPNIIFTGWLAPEESAWLLQRSNLGLATYIPEATMSWPNKLWSYLAHGLPMICSLGGASRELIRSQGIGIGYTAGDAVSLAGAVEMLADNAPQRDSMAANAGELFHSRFRSDMIYSGMARHLLELAGSRREASR
jgi:glycosyltransferase involved in cell wall biosynthesis